MSHSKLPCTARYRLRSSRRRRSLLPRKSRRSSELLNTATNTGANSWFVQCEPRGVSGDFLWHTARPGYPAWGRRCEVGLIDPVLDLTLHHTYDVTELPIVR